MKQANHVTTLFRISLAIALVVVTYFTTAQITHTTITSINDKLGHALTFTILALLIDFSFPDYTFNWQKGSVLFAYGVAIEFIQFYIPYRSFSILDMVADVMGIGLYLILLPVLKYVPLLKLRWHKVDCN